MHAYESYGKKTVTLNQSVDCIIRRLNYFHTMQHTKFLNMIMNKMKPKLYDEKIVELFVVT